MQYLKKASFSIVCIVVGFLVVFTFLEGFNQLLFFPLIGITFFALLYHRTFEQKGHGHYLANANFQQWIRHDVIVHFFAHVKKKHWPIIIYSLIFGSWIVYLWTHLTFGSDVAVQNILLTGFVIVMLGFYTVVAPPVLNYVHRCLPDNTKKYLNHDVIRGYVFLLPLTFLAYVLSPFLGDGEPLINRIFALPVFIIGYTLLFLGAFTIIFTYQETHMSQKKKH